MSHLFKLFGKRARKFARVFPFPDVQLSAGNLVSGGKARTLHIKGLCRIATNLRIKHVQPSLWLVCMALEAVRFGRCLVADQTPSWQPRPEMSPVESVFARLSSDLFIVVSAIRVARARSGFGQRGLKKGLLQRRFYLQIEGWSNGQVVSGVAALGDFRVNLLACWQSGKEDVAERVLTATSGTRSIKSGGLIWRHHRQQVSFANCTLTGMVGFRPVSLRSKSISLLGRAASHGLPLPTLFHRLHFDWCWSNFGTVFPQPSLVLQVRKPQFPHNPGLFFY